MIPGVISISSAQMSLYVRETVILAFYSAEASGRIECKRVLVLLNLVKREKNLVLKVIQSASAITTILRTVSSE